MRNIKFETIMMPLTLAVVLIAIVHMGISIAEYNQEVEYKVLASQVANLRK